jgi:transposase
MRTTRGAHRDFAALEARRFQAARMFGQGMSQVTVARELGVSRTTTHRWYHAWRRKGRGALQAAGRAGRKPRLNRRQLAGVEAALLKGPAAHGFATTLWTLPRIATVIARRTGVRYHPAHVWRILQGLQWSLQRPARQARERDEAAVGRWRRQRWPQVKKTRGAGTPG